MATAPSLITEQRRDQIFPTFDASDIDRLRRFGRLRAYEKDSYLARIGQPSAGLHVILSGSVEISERDGFGRSSLIVAHGSGSIMAELAVLSGRPALTDALATSAVEAIVIPTQRLRDVMIEEAELGERIMRALILRRVALIERGHTGPVIIGRGGETNVLRLSNYLSRNGHPHQFLEPDSDEQVRALVERFHVQPLDLPIVLCPNGQILRNPREHELAQCIGLLVPLNAKKLYDVAIVGAGPAGLAAAVYAGSEGLSVIVLDCRAFGGQAGASMRIENYLGFPTGITGMALMARAFNQAQKFGVEMSIPEEVVRLRDDPEHGGLILETQSDGGVRARSVVVATGARYRRLDVPNLSDYEGAHVHYWASPLEGRLCASEEVALVGAGNSAGQAAVYLASVTPKVHLLMRGSSLEASMSRYLIERIRAQPNIVVHPETEIVALEGAAGALQSIRSRHRRTGYESTHACRHLFLFIGADPNTEWLRSYGIALDAKGFVLTNAELGQNDLMHETSRPGVFAIGDVRSTSVKRVASAVGEGAQVVATIHAYLGRLADAKTVALGKRA